MKLLAGLILIVSVAFGANIKWEKDYATALKQSKQLNKPIMFIVSSHHCHFCVQFENTTLKDPKVVQKLSSDYINAIAYVEDDPVFPHDLYVGGTPATWFLKGNGEPLFDPVMGAVDPINFAKALDVVTKEYKKIKK